MQDLKREKKKSWTGEELLPILRYQAERYTSGESSSVSYETAQRLMEGIVYTMEQAAGGQEFPEAFQTDIFAVWRQGKERIRQMVGRIKKLRQEIQEDFQSFGNLCLEETVKKDLPRFFACYDLEFFPQDPGILLEYPVLEDLESYEGAEKVYHYIRGICWENRWIKGLSGTYVRETLEQWPGDYRLLTENLSLILLEDLIFRGIKKLGKLSQEEISSLEMSQKNGMGEEVKKLLEEILCRCGIEEEEMKEYFRKKQRNLEIQLLNRIRREKNIFRQ